MSKHPYIQNVRFTKDKLPKSAKIQTVSGSVYVKWLDVAGDRCWFSSGTYDAKRAAVPLIEAISNFELP